MAQILMATVGPSTSRQVVLGAKDIDDTYNIANFRGFRDSTGKRAKQMTKQTRAAALQAPKTSRRSHLLTVVRVHCQSGTFL